MFLARLPWKDSAARSSPEESLNFIAQRPWQHLIRPNCRQEEDDRTSKTPMTENSEVSKELQAIFEQVRMISH